MARKMSESEMTERGAIDGMFRRLDAGVRVPQRLSYESMLRRSANTKRRTWLRPALTASAVTLAAVLLVAGISRIPTLSAKDASYEAETNSFYYDANDLSAGGESSSASAEPKTDIVEKSEEENLSEQNDAAQPYAAGNYLRLLEAMDGALGDFAHVLAPYEYNSDEAEEDGGVIVRLTVSIETTVITQESPEFALVCEEVQSQPVIDVVTSGGRRVYSIYSEELGTLICIDDVNTGTIASAIQLHGVDGVQSLTLHNDELIVIADCSRDFGRITVGTFGAMLVDVFDISDSGSPELKSRFGCEGDFFTVITSAGRVFVAAQRFGVDRVDMKNMTVNGANYIPKVMCNGEYEYIAPSDIYVAPEIASMDYLILFSVDGVANRPLAYFGTSDPLVAVNFLMGKFK